MPDKIRRLFFDIETSPNEVFSWRIGNRLSIPFQNIRKERQIITVAWKWEGSRTIHALDWGDEQCDRLLLKHFLPVIGSADEVVAHFGDGFDIPWIKTRALFWGFENFWNWKTVDTKAWASRYFNFNCNKLDYIAQYLGIGKKIETTYDLWVDVIDRKPGSLAKMVKYNKHDVTLLEPVYNRLSLIGPLKTHAGVFEEREKWTCPRCASSNVRRSKKYVTASGVTQRQMKCNDCSRHYNVSARGISYVCK